MNLYEILWHNRSGLRFKYASRILQPGASRLDQARVGEGRVVPAGRRGQSLSRRNVGCSTSRPGGRDRTQIVRAGADAEGGRGATRGRSRGVTTIERG